MKRPTSIRPVARNSPMFQSATLPSTVRMAPRGFLRPRCSQVEPKRCQLGTETESLTQVAGCLDIPRTGVTDCDGQFSTACRCCFDGVQDDDHHNPPVARTARRFPARGRVCFRDGSGPAGLQQGRDQDEQGQPELLHARWTGRHDWRAHRPRRRVHGRCAVRAADREDRRGDQADLGRPDPLPREHARPRRSHRRQRKPRQDGRNDSGARKPADAPRKAESRRQRRARRADAGGRSSGHHLRCADHRSHERRRGEADPGAGRSH